MGITVLRERMIHVWTLGHNDVIRARTLAMFGSLGRVGSSSIVHNCIHRTPYLPCLPTYLYTGMLARDRPWAAINSRRSGCGSDDNPSGPIRLMQVFVRIDGRDGPVDLLTRPNAQSSSCCQSRQRARIRVGSDARGKRTVL